MKLSAVFLCGDRSPYGLAHLDAIAESFDLKALIVADKERWAHFRSVLSGGETYVYQKATVRWSRRLRAFLSWPLELVRETRHIRRLETAGAPIYIFHDANSPDALHLIKSLNPQVLLSAAYPQIFKKTLLDIALHGAVNFHPSLLPRCRGAHPHYWCLATGEKMGGVTAHYMTEQIDAGDIIAQRSFELDGLYYNDVYCKIVEETPQLVFHVASFLTDKKAISTPQDESLVSLFRNDREIHHRLDFLQMTARQLHNRIRAGRAYGVFRGKRTNIVRAEVAINNRHVTNEVVIPPGVVADIDQNGVWIAAKDGQFLIANKLTHLGRECHFSKWIDANTVQIGERFD